MVSRHNQYNFTVSVVEVANWLYSLYIALLNIIYTKLIFYNYNLYLISSLEDQNTLAY